MIKLISTSCPLSSIVCLQQVQIHCSLDLQLCLEAYSTILYPCNKNLWVEDNRHLDRLAKLASIAYMLLPKSKRWNKRYRVIGIMMVHSTI